MSISVGGIDLTSGILNAELRIAVLEKLVDRILPLLPPGTVTASDIEKIRSDAFKDLQHKYPHAGITKM